MFDSSESCRPTPAYSTVTINLLKPRRMLFSAALCRLDMEARVQCRGRCLFCKGRRHLQLQWAVLCAWRGSDAGWRALRHYFNTGKARYTRHIRPLLALFGLSSMSDLSPKCASSGHRRESNIAAFSNVTLNRGCPMSTASETS